MNIKGTEVDNGDIIRIRTIRREYVGYVYFDLNIFAKTIYDFKLCNSPPNKEGILFRNKRVKNIEILRKCK